MTLYRSVHKLKKLALIFLPFACFLKLSKLSLTSVILNGDVAAEKEAIITHVNACFNFLTRTYSKLLDPSRARAKKINVHIIHE